MPAILKVLRVLIALGLLALLVYFTGARELLEAFARLSLGSIFWLLVLSVLLVVVSAIKWRLFLAELAADRDGNQNLALNAVPSVGVLTGLYLVGYFVNLLFPSLVGGDVVRSYYAGKKSGQHAAAAATILERYTGLLAMVLLAFAFMWKAPLVTWQIRTLIALIALAIFSATLVLLSPSAIRLFEKLPGAKKISAHLHEVQAGFHLARKRKLLVSKAMLLSFVFHTLTVLNTLIAAEAVGWSDAPVMGLFVVLPIILLLGALPISPSGLGIQEGAFFYFLQGLGASPAQALGVALVLRAKSYILALVGGLVLLRFKQADNKRVSVGANVDAPG